MRKKVAEKKEKLVKDKIYKTHNFFKVRSTTIKQYKEES
jgi:hypothetical protein